MFIKPPRGARRLPWLGVLTFVLVAIGLWLRNGSEPPVASRTSETSARAPAPATESRPRAESEPAPPSPAPPSTAPRSTPGPTPTLDPHPERPRPPAARPEPPAGATQRELRVFGPDVGFRSRERWLEHWEKHGAEFAQLEIRTPEQYLAAAQALRDGPASGWVLEAVRADGVVTLFDQRTSCFLAYNHDGTIRTFFRPNDGVAYFRRQAQREP